MKTKKFLSLLLAILLCFSCFSIISFAETTDGEHLTTVPEGYVGIYTKDDLDNIKLDLSGKYILMNDIVFTEEDYAEGGSFYNSGKGWEPIGTGTNPFKGTFNGNNYTIHNLTIKTTNSYTGLFGYVECASIHNVCLANVFISTTGGSVGGICGYLKGSKTLHNCTVSGTINGSNNVGGICGNAIRYSSSTTACLFYKCANSASVTATNGIVGGICGYLDDYQVNNTYNSYYPITIDSCINTGNITGKTSGGIVGSCDNKNHLVKDSYNTGAISGKSSGGLVGYYCSMKNSYSVGTAETNSLIGTPANSSNYQTSISFCYFLEDVLADTTATHGTGKSHDQMIKQTTYEGWDFDTIWTMEGRKDYPYPELRDVPLIFPDELNHKHEYSSEITTPATHLAEGVMTYTCSCGDTYTEAIAKTTEHTYNTIVTEPTCTDKGFTLYFCACNDFYMADYVEANGHSHTTEITTPATHLTEGLMTFTCACGDTYTAAIAKTTEHTYNAVVTAPTCTEKGYTTYTCACGDTYVADYVDATGHSHTATVTTPATHLTEGLLTYTCTCGDTYTEAMAKTTEHKYTFVVTAPTCAERGFTTYTCACGDSYIADYVDIIEHKDANSDKCCDYCNDFLGTEKEEKDCSHMCHSSGIWGIIWKILSLFYKLFGVSPVCECGAAHY